MVSNDAIADDDLGDAAPETLDRARESLCERESERFDEILSRPFDYCVAAIRSDLGLAPESDGDLDTADVPSSPDCAMPIDETPAPLGQMFGLCAHDPPDSG